MCVADGPLPFPPSSDPATGHSEHKILLGTHAGATDTNYVMIAKVLLPGEDAECDPRKYDDETGGTSLAGDVECVDGCGEQVPAHTSSAPAVVRTRSVVQPVRTECTSDAFHNSGSG